LLNHAPLVEAKAQDQQPKVGLTPPLFLFHAGQYIQLV
jgi:hypothetical protein